MSGRGGVTLLGEDDNDESIDNDSFEHDSRTGEDGNGIGEDVDNSSGWR